MSRGATGLPCDAMRGNRDIRPHNHAPSFARRVDYVQSGKTMEYRGDNIEGEAPPCQSCSRLPLEYSERRGGPPSVYHG